MLMLLVEDDVSLIRILSFPSCVIYSIVSTPEAGNMTRLSVSMRGSSRGLREDGSDGVGWSASGDEAEMRRR